MTTRELTDILNWRRLDAGTTLSGQPTEAQLAGIARLGVTHVVNLGPHTNEGALEDEAGTVAALGMTYVHIPVDFDGPTEADFAAFCDAMERLSNERVHVHCLYNARVTAFIHRRARAGRGGSEAETRALMDGVWRPGGVWATFVGDDDAVDLPNRYAGEDY